MQRSNPHELTLFKTLIHLLLNVKFIIPSNQNYISINSIINLNKSLYKGTLETLISTHLKLQIHLFRPTIF